MPPQVQGTQAPRIPLNTEFGHAPLGKLDKRSVLLGEASQTRTTTTGPSAKDISTRTASPLPPGATKADKTFSKDLGEFSAKMSSTLGKLATEDTSTPAGKQRVQAALQELHHAGFELQKKYGTSYDSVSKAQFELKYSQMTPEQQQSVQIGLSKASQNGIDLKGLRVLSGPLTPEAQAILEIHLEEPLGRQDMQEHFWEDGTPSGVSERFYNTMLTSNIVIPGHGLNFLVDENHRGDEAHMKEGVAKFRQFVGNDQKLFSLSLQANERLLDGVNRAQTTGAGPVILHDGRSGILGGPTGDTVTTTFFFTKDAGGEVNLKLAHEVKSQHILINGTAHFLEKPESSIFHLEVGFSKTGDPELRNPPRFSYTPGTYPPWKSEVFNRPLDLQDVMNRREETELQEAFMAQCVNDYQPGSLEFLRAYNDIGPHTTLADAQALGVKYLTPDDGRVGQAIVSTSTPLNMSNPDLNRMRQEINQLTPQTFNGDALKAILEPARAEMTTVLKDNSFKAFVKDYQQS